MTKEIKQIKNRILPILKSRDIKKAAIFGSYVRNEQKPESDIDILVELKKGNSLFDLIGLEFDLQDKLGKKVDLLTYKSIHPLLKESILREQQPIL